MYIYSGALFTALTHTQRPPLLCARIYNTIIYMCVCVKYVRIYIRGGYIKRVSFICAARGTEKKWKKKPKKRSSVGVKTPLVGVYYTYICMYKKYTSYGLQTETVAVSFAERGENVSSR